MAALTFETVQFHMKDVLKDKIVVGHALFHDLAVLQHRHVYEDIRDTALYYPLRLRVGVNREGQYPSLRTLVKEVLDRDIQGGAHCPVSVSSALANGKLEDARATMDVFLSVRETYEAALAAGDDVVAGLPGYVCRPVLH